MSILDNINPFNKDDTGRSDAGKKKGEKDVTDRPANPHETGDCCGGCGGLQETEK